eukprot:CAMPEP_0195315228 /NCGR_PEP_ID=MMETSP0708-20121125/2877_1 /TAXON_ID=33640 /ORGANISM="Asterionellopsis glacialis, Strain CCMP134" /LENGTH=119 /DNA_ID=CAMNT_0040380395 /DNA_START=302 /DNA_END=661 /DNA_ORIENTATION=-
MQDLSFDNRPRRFLLTKISAAVEKSGRRKSDHPLDLTAAAHLIAEKFLRHFNPNTRAVTGLAVSINCAAVPDILQRLNTHLNDLTPRLSVQGGDQTNPAGAMLVFGIIGVSIDQTLAVL